MAGGLACAVLAGAAASRDTATAQAAPREPSTAEFTATVAATHVTRKVSDVPFGHLEHASRLATLFARLRALETHQATTDVRIMQLGDSHTASDYGTSVARARLGSRFGDGGRGFLPMGRPYKRLFQAGELVTHSIGFEPDETALPPKHVYPDGFFGLGGVAMDARSPGASMSSEIAASTDRFELAYLAQPGGGSFDVLVDGQRVEHVATDATDCASAYRAFAVSRGPHSLEARATGDGPVRIFGVRLDDDRAGITLDALGINGAKATNLLGTDVAHFGEQLGHVAPSLVILAYGTNEAGDSVTTPDDHVEALRTLAGRIHAAAPDAACLVLGPPDRAAGWGAHTIPKLGEMIAAQRQAADEARCAFYDQLAAMGGNGTIGAWANESPPRARRDLVHLTRAGYAFLAEALVRDLTAAYDARDPDAP